MSLGQAKLERSKIRKYRKFFESYHVAKYNEIFIRGNNTSISIG